MAMEHRCKDCRAVAEAWAAWLNDRRIDIGMVIEPPKPPVKPRPAPHPGPRCATHHRIVTKARKAAAHERHVKKTYGLKDGDYQRLYEFQDGRCYMCLRATGKTKRLPVDHDHQSGLVRGLLCSPCNQILGHARDEIAFFERAIAYLAHPPAKRIGLEAHAT